MKGYVHKEKVSTLSEFVLDSPTFVNETFPAHAHCLFLLLVLLNELHTQRSALNKQTQVPAKSCQQEKHKRKRM